MAENRELALVLKLVADNFQSELKKSQGLLGDFTGFLKDWKTQLTAVGAALVAVAKSTANYGDELVKASQRMGTTIEDTARLQHAARLSDTDLQGLSKSVGILSKTMYESASGNAEARDKFDRLGLSATTINGQLKGTTEVLLELNDKFRLMPDGPEKTALALLTLGKSGAAVLPLLNSNMREAFAEADQLGLVMGDKAAKAGEHFNDELTKLAGAVRGVTNDVGVLLIPQLDVLTHALTQIVTDAHAAAAALTGLNTSAAPQVGVVKPAEGGRNLRILPPPPGVEKAAPSPFFQTEAQAKEQEAIGKRLTESFVGQYKVGLALGKEQEQLGKALLEMHLTDQRSIEIANKLRTEGADAYYLSLLRQVELEKIDGDEQERKGRSTVEQTTLAVRIREASQASERDSLVENAKAWVAYDEQVGASTELRYTHQVDGLRASLAQQLQLTTEETGRLLIAWQNHDADLASSILDRTTLTAQQRETLELQSLTRLAQANEQASDDIFSGWSRGMQRYVQDTKSGFGLAADLARRTAQMMEQAFQSFFFDLFDGKIKTLKDALKGVLDFVKQIAAKIAAQLAVKAIRGGFSLGSGASTGGDASAGVLANAGGMIQRFATGGPVFGVGNQDTVPAWLTPGEFVLSRQDVGDIKRGMTGAGGGGSLGDITVNIIDSGQTQKPQVNARNEFGKMVLDVIFRDYAANGDMRKLIQGA